MRLADFILQNLEPILKEWESFARTTEAGAKLDRTTLRDHAQEILRATARDMVSAQNQSLQAGKSLGRSDAGDPNGRLKGASTLHAIGRVDSGFDMMEVVSEYRALRASVIRLWRKNELRCDRQDLDDLTRFNEEIDQSLTDAVDAFTKRVDQSRQMFLAILAHDLRNPLNSISMSAQLLMRKKNLDAESLEDATQMSASASVIDKMITDLIDYSSSQLGGRMPITPARMDLEALAREVFSECHMACPTAKLHFHAQGDMTGTWDAARLRQVISNLLGNAIQHGRPSAPVQVALKADANDVIMTFHNEGTPIPKDILPTIFDPLIRGTSTEPHKPHRPGSIGLGLYIAREIATAHGGTLTVDSSADQGTLFTLRLPRHAKVAKEIPARRPAASVFS